MSHHQQDEDAASNNEVPGFEDVEEGGDSDIGNMQTDHMIEATSTLRTQHDLGQHKHGKVMRKT